MTYDVHCGESVLITTTDADAAERIADAIEAEREHLFQYDGLAFGVRASGRDASSSAEPTYETYELEPEPTEAEEADEPDDEEPEDEPDDA